jgi:hypothetical protein
MKPLSLCLGLVVVVAACTDLVAPDAVPLNRTYVLQSCNQSVAGSTHCQVFGSGSTEEYIDSSRIVFGAGRSATWTSWLTKDVNGCYLSGGSCHVISKPVDVNAGTYTFVTDTINLLVTSGPNAGTTLKLAGNIASSVDKSWAGPDSLSTFYPRGNASGLRLRFK